jgi:hypothetical protein
MRNKANYNIDRPATQIVIPAKAGIHKSKFMTHGPAFMDSRLRGNDVFLPS